MKRLLNQASTWTRLLQKIVLSIIVLVSTTQLLIAPAHATSLYELPSLPADTWVIDKAEVLSFSNEGRISSALADLAKQTGFEVRMVSIHRLDYDETAQSFAEKLFEQWFPNPEEQANQVLLVIDNVTNNTGIQSGENAKRLLSNEIAQSVAQETVVIPLKDGNKYNQALLGASDRLVAVLSGEPDPGPPQLQDTIRVESTFATREQTKSSNATFWVIVILIVATVVPMATYYFYQWMGSR